MMGIRGVGLTGDPPLSVAAAVGMTMGDASCFFVLVGTHVSSSLRTVRDIHIQNHRALLQLVNASADISHLKLHHVLRDVRGRGSQSHVRTLTFIIFIVVFFLSDPTRCLLLLT